MTTTVALVGAGNIAGPYAESISHHRELNLIGVYDLDIVRSTSFAEARGITRYTSLDELSDAQPAIVVNLTSAPFHYETSMDLLARRHNVFSEKPLALNHQQADELVAVAQKCGVRLGCAPSLWLGESAQAAAGLARSGEIGPIRLVTAQVSQGRIETWHPAPQLFYAVGPVADVGVYPLAYLTAVLGPISEVWAMSSTLLGERVTLGCESFAPGSPDSWFAIAKFRSGPILRLSCNFYVDAKTEPRHIDFHGDDGSLRLIDFFAPGAGIDRADFGGAFKASRLADSRAVDWSLGVIDMAEAMDAGRPHRTSAEHAAHIVEILDGIGESARTGQWVGVESAFPDPFVEPQSWESR